MKILGFRRLLGLAALGGGVYWMQKKRGGDMTFASIKENFRGLASEVMDKVNSLQGAAGQQSANDPLASGENVSQGASASRPSATGYGSTGTYTGSGGSGGYGGTGGYGGSGGTGGTGGFGGGGGGTRH